MTEQATSQEAADTIQTPPPVVPDSSCSPSNYISPLFLPCIQPSPWPGIRNSVLNPMPPVPTLKIVPAITDESKLPKPPESLINGVLRERGKMLLTGASKSWKSFLSIQLGLSIANGIEWLGFECRQGKVLYLNLEIDDAQFMTRIFNMVRSLSLKPEVCSNNFDVVCRSNKSYTIEDYVRALESVRGRQYDLVIIDPLYKAFDGAENSQEDMAAFFSQVDELVFSLGCAVLVVHHQSKGWQGHKDVSDRASGSGVLSRDPDAIVDICRTDGGENTMRAQFVLRDYPEPSCVDYWVKDGVAIVDTENKLSAARIASPHQNGIRKGKDLKLKELEEACEELMQSRSRFPRTELRGHLKGWKDEIIGRYLKKSMRFRGEKERNRWFVYRE